MPRKKCAYGFSCASMMMTPGLTAEDCPNAQTCGTLKELTEDETAELLQVRATDFEEFLTQLRQTAPFLNLRQFLEMTVPLTEEEEALIARRREEMLERQRVTRREAAVMMLMRRGNPQQPEDFGISYGMAEIERRIFNLRDRLENFTDTYIAPEGVVAHHYSVKRPWGTYQYNKLLAESAIFEPSEEDHPVRVIHLSRDDDDRNIEARKGLIRRDRLSQIADQLRLAETALNEAVELAGAPVEVVLDDNVE